MTERSEGDGGAVSYLALTRGTPVETATGTPMGTVEHVLQVPDLDLFDGIVVATAHGLRFVDRDQIGAITTRAVHCNLSDEEASGLPAPSGPPVYRVDAFDDVGGALTARLGRLFNRGHWLKEER